MAQFEFEAGVNDCLKKLEAPLSRGPAPRWQRKEKQRSLPFAGKPFSPLQTTSRSRVPAKSKRFTSGQKSANTPKKTPRKSPKKYGLTPCGDRFIPNRPLTDCEWSHFQVMHGSEVNDTSCEMELEANQEYGAIIAENLGYNPANSKILRFKSGAPLTKEGLCCYLDTKSCYPKSCNSYSWFASSRLNFRIPGHLFAFHWIRIGSIVLSLVLQKMPHRGNNSG